ncbi:hypothetical protein NYO67_3112 [Aspergillus flavus]|nr:hypothetical protein NYO67_3112 [Aspergillus flavus]
MATVYLGLRDERFESRLSTLGTPKEMKMTVAKSDRREVNLYANGQEHPKFLWAEATLHQPAFGAQAHGRMAVCDKSMQAWLDPE